MFTAKVVRESEYARGIMAEMERKYAMTSEDFYTAAQVGKLPAGVTDEDAYEWLSAIEALRNPSDDSGITLTLEDIEAAGVEIDRGKTEPCSAYSWPDISECWGVLFGPLMDDADLAARGLNEPSNLSWATDRSNGRLLG
ncbi:MAG: hypothetical protein QME79_11455 [Bacillota bacterium]|nr:hypothetical protein [Bacillota bacterium]